MAMVSNQAPRVEDAIEPIELPAVHSSPAVAALRQSDEHDEFGTTTQAVSEPIQRRGTFRTFTVMTALFVSNSSI